MGCGYFDNPDFTGESSGLSAEIEILDWSKTNYGFLENWFSVKIQYKIENTGDFSIDYHEIHFSVVGAGEEVYKNWTTVIEAVDPGDTASDFAYVDATGQIEDVFVDKYILKNYEHDIEVEM